MADLNETHLERMLEAAAVGCVYCSAGGIKPDCTCQQMARDQYESMVARARMTPPEEDVGMLARDLSSLLSRLRDATGNRDVDPDLRVALAQAVVKLEEADAILSERL